MKQLTGEQLTGDASVAKSIDKNINEITGKPAPWI
jgi:hypothetical protein